MKRQIVKDLFGNEMIQGSRPQQQDKNQIGLFEDLARPKFDVPKQSSQPVQSAKLIEEQKEFF